MYKPTEDQIARTMEQLKFDRLTAIRHLQSLFAAQEALRYLPPQQRAEMILGKSALYA